MDPTPTLPRFFTHAFAVVCTLLVLTCGAAVVFTPILLGRIIALAWLLVGWPLYLGIMREIYGKEGE